MKSASFRFFAVTASIAAWLAAAPAVARADYVDTLQFGIDTGYRVDNLDWNIAGHLDGTNPNVLSELTWKDLKIYQAGASGRLAVGNQYVNFLTYLRGSFDYGWIMNGGGQDADYLGDNRTDEVSLSGFSTDDDNVLDASIGLGFQWRFWRNRLSIAPLGGYSIHEQNLRNTKGVQLFSGLPGLPALGPFPAALTLNETYDATWKGPWAGVDIELKPVPRFSLLGTFEYHWAEYEGDANWNLRADYAHPLSFRDKTDHAHGVVVKVTGCYRLTGGWALDLAVAYQDWKAKDGTDTSFLAAGGTTATKLNEVNWKSSAVTAGVSYKFY